MTRAADVFNLEEDGADPEWDDAIQQEFADEGLTSADVLGRIEEFVAEYVQHLAQGELPPLEIVSRAKANTFYAPAGEQGGVSAAVGSLVQTRCLFVNQASSANSYVRVFKVLAATHQLLRSGCTATQRDLYYKLQQPRLFSKPEHVNTAIQDACCLLRVPRSALNITCSSKGLLAGCICVRDSPTAAWQDLSVQGTAVKAIPGSLAAINNMTIRSDARCLLIIEKDAIFQRLAEGGLHNQLPCIMVTAKGSPDLATRALCAKIVAQYPDMTVLGLVDYNPHGVMILRTYKFGSHRMGLESHRYALPQLQWLGVRSGWLVDVDARDMQTLTPRDLGLLPGLEQSLRAAANAEDPEAQARTQTQDSPLHDTRGISHTAGYCGRQDVTLWSDEEDTEECDHAAAGAQHSQGMVEGVWHLGTERAHKRSRSSGAGSSLYAQMDAWVEELECMRVAGFKADIESVYSVLGYGGVQEMVVEAVLREDYI